MTHSRIIFHVDMDAFFAAVEQRDNPEYRGKPVVVGAKPGTRGVVATCSYEARVYGVRSAMPISEAVRRLPKNTIYVSGGMSRYSAVSKQLMALFEEFSPRVEPISVDEAFLDMSGMERLMGEPLTMARKLSEEIRHRLGITGSVGVAPNKFLAKLASDMKKPAGITVTPFDSTEIIHFLAPLPVGRLWGVGEATVKQLNLLGVKTVGDLQQLPEKLLLERFGKNGHRLAKIRFGVDDRPVEKSGPAKSISREHTFQNDVCDPEELQGVLRWVCDDVTRRARKKSVKGRTVTLTWRNSDFSRRSASKTLSHGVDSAEEMFREVISLMKESFPAGGTVRLIGAGISGFDASHEQQLSLFDNSEIDAQEERENWRKRDRAVDAVHERFGSSLLVRGREKKKKTDNRQE